MRSSSKRLRRQQKSQRLSPGSDQEGRAGTEAGSACRNLSALVSPTYVELVTAVESNRGLLTSHRSILMVPAIMLAALVKQ